jgi:hypothetical protein
MPKHLVGIILNRIFVIESLTKPTSHDHADRNRRFCSSLFRACTTGSNNAGIKSSIMKKFIYVSKEFAVEAECVNEFIRKMVNRGFNVKNVVSEKEAESPNPIYDFSWKVGCPEFGNVCGPMKDGEKIRYESWEVYETLST